MGGGKDEEEKQIPDPSNKASLFLSLTDELLVFYTSGSVDSLNRLLLHIFKKWMKISFGLRPAL